MAHSGERVADVACTEDRLIVKLADRCSISRPLAWCRRLLRASSRERDNGEIAGAGFGSHGPACDREFPLDPYSCWVRFCLSRRTLQMG